jgi:hypothetical protein
LEQEEVTEQEVATAAEKTATSATKPATSPVPDPPIRYFLVLFHDLQFEPPSWNSIDSEIVMHLRRECDDKIEAARDRVEIDLWLESGGGDAHAAYKLALLLRAHARRLCVIVPDYAKSAATLLALAADEIYMAPAAELGPLDAQIPREGGLISAISALDIARSVDDLAQTAFSLALEGGADVLHTTRLTRAEYLSMMLDFGAKFMEPIVRQPTLIHWSSTLLAVSVEYAQRLLRMREIGWSPQAARIPAALVGDYPTHGFVISRSEAQDQLGLPVRQLADYEYGKEALALHRSFEDDRINVARLMTQEEMTDATVEGGNENED